MISCNKPSVSYWIHIYQWNARLKVPLILAVLDQMPANSQNLFPKMTKKKAKKELTKTSENDKRIKLLKDKMDFEKQNLKESNQKIIMPKIQFKPNPPQDAMILKLQDLKIEEQELKRLQSMAKSLIEDEPIVNDRITKTRQDIELKEKELSDINMKINELVAKKHSMNANLQVLKQGNTTDLSLLKETESAKGELQMIEQKLETTSRQIMITKKIAEENRIKQEEMMWYKRHNKFEFFHAHGNYFLIESDFVSFGDLLRLMKLKPTIDTKESIKADLLQLVDARLHSASICPTDAGGGQCNITKCPYNHFSDLKKSEGGKLCDYLKIMLTTNEENTRLLNELQNHGIDNVLNNKKYQQILLEVINEQNNNVEPNSPGKVNPNTSLKPLLRSLKTIAHLNRDMRKRESYHSLEGTLEALRKNPSDISGWVSHIMYNLPPSKDVNKGLKSARVAMEIVERGLSFNPESEVLLSIYCELYSLIYSNDPKKVREMFKNCLEKNDSNHLKWIYLEWEHDYKEKEQWLKKTFEEAGAQRIANAAAGIQSKSDSEFSYMMLNLLTNLLRLGTESALNIVAQSLGLVPGKPSVLNWLFPVHHCNLVLYFCVALKFGRLGSELFYDSPNHFLCIAQPFLINWDFVLVNNYNNILIEYLLLMTMGTFMHHQQFGLLQCLIRNYAGFRKHIGHTYHELINDVYFDLGAFEDREECKLLKLMMLVEFDEGNTLQMQPILSGRDCDNWIEFSVLLKLGFRYGGNVVIDLINTKLGNERSELKSVDKSFGALFDKLRPELNDFSKEKVDVYALYLYLLSGFATNNDIGTIMQWAEKMELRDIQKSLLWGM